MSDPQTDNLIASRLRALESAGRRRFARCVQTLPDGNCVVDGQKAVNFGGNDYLGLASELAADLQNVTLNQIGSTGSALICGRSPAHAELERSLADFEQTQAALLFPTGYAANMGLLTALAEQPDAIFCDRDNHASIVDACRLSRADLCVYRRHELDRLEAALKTRRTRYRHVFLVTDGVFSMDGAIAPLEQLCDIADRYQAEVIVDEAHATGVIGEHGRGATEKHHVENRVLARVGTMSKSMGGMGGFVCGSEALIELLRNAARTQFFSTALPPLICAIMQKSIDVIKTQPQRRLQLLNLSKRLHTRLCDHEIPAINDELTPIVGIPISGDERVMLVSKALLKEGFFVPAVRYPTVRQSAERLRVSLTTQHTGEDIDRFTETLSRILQSCAE